MYFGDFVEMVKYDDFIEKVNEAGFWNQFTNYIDQGIFIYGTKIGQAYSGDNETDTEIWKNRVAQEKKLAYGHFFNGKPGGYIAPHFYSIFIDAFRPRVTMEERYKSGKLSKYEREIWDLLNQKGKPLSFSDFRNNMGIVSKDKIEYRKLESALKQLQMTFDITICGIINGQYENGEPFSFTGYDKVDNWIPKEWMEMNPRMEHKEALEIIYNQAEKITNMGEYKKPFAKSLKLYNWYL